MIKELILAVILGSLLGFGLTGGYLAVKNSKVTTVVPEVTASPTPKNTETKAVSTPSPSPTSNPEDLQTSNNQITIESPLNESIVTNSPITLKGSTNPLSYLIITTPIKSYFTSADNNGNFSISIEIESGYNQVQIDSFDPQDNQSSAELLVTYSTAKF